MNLARMQDIGGLRAIVSNITQVYTLEGLYRNSKFQHELISSKDYISSPKSDGYRGIHLIYRYKNKSVPEYNGLSLELQIRTKLQHAWATAVETMGTFLGQALKSGQGEQSWHAFFSTASAALTILEKTNSIPGFEKHTKEQIYRQLYDYEKQLHVLDQLRGFAIAAKSITTFSGQGGYHLITLDSVKRTVTIKPYSVSKLEQANLDYTAIESRTRAGESIEAVLVSAGPIKSLRKAYPNYFLDTQVFIHHLQRLINSIASQSSSRSK
jgi:hypothetical protein